MKTQILTNKNIQLLKNLSQKKFRQQYNLFIVEGWNSIKEVADSNLKIEFLLYSTIPKSQFEVFKKAKLKAENIFETTEKIFSKLSSLEHSQGVMAVVKPVDVTLDAVLNLNSKLIIALDSISDPGNLGAVIRTCDWFGASGILISKNSVDLYNSKVVQSSMGSLFHLPISCNINLVEAINIAKNSGFQVIGTEVYGKNIISEKKINSIMSQSKKIMIVFGNEAHGISEEVKKQIPNFFTLSKFGKAESLNVAVSVGVILAGIKNE